jgi:hypothetical protein
MSSNTNDSAAVGIIIGIEWNPSLLPTVER